MDYSEVALEIEKIGASHIVDPNIWQLRVGRDDALDYVVVSLIRKVAAFRGAEVIRVPLTWWDAVKERFAPDWFLARWPVDYREIRADAMLPDVPLPQRYQEHAWRTLVTL